MTSHTRTTPLVPAVAKRRPSGEKTTAVTFCDGSGNFNNSLPAGTCHRYTHSLAPAASSWPSGEKSRE